MSYYSREASLTESTSRLGGSRSGTFVFNFLKMFLKYANEQSALHNGDYHEGMQFVGLFGLVHAYYLRWYNSAVITVDISCRFSTDKNSFIDYSHRSFICSISIGHMQAVNFAVFAK